MIRLKHTKIVVHFKKCVCNVLTLCGNSSDHMNTNNTRGAERVGAKSKVSRLSCMNIEVRESVCYRKVELTHSQLGILFRCLWLRENFAKPFKMSLRPLLMQRLISHWFVRSSIGSQMGLFLAGARRGFSMSACVRAAPRLTAWRPTSSWTIVLVFDFRTSLVELMWA